MTVADVNPDMLSVGMERAKQRAITGLIWQVENAEKLSFADRSFDAYTIAFGIRNVTDIPAALHEAHRVLRRGGRFYCLEFSTSEWPGFGELYDRYSDKLIPRIGKHVADDEASYRYLVESIRRFPSPDRFRAMIADASLTGRDARITVNFDADIAAVTRDAHGAVVAGSVTDAVETHDVWTFARTLKSSDPNWKLADTDEA